MIKGVLQLHLTTEKSTIIREGGEKYVFRVARKADKMMIKKAVEEAFKVKVDSVRTMIVAGKTKRMGRNVGKTPTWKKALVKLKKGQVIADFESV
ncbi:MAG: 50S ribosomal protein L23 [candidate division Zixibacteria bacterium]|nr:50S ribosomal protein L23 [candidate division Zixibacteria bacterium]